MHRSTSSWISGVLLPVVAVAVAAAFATPSSPMIRSSAAGGDADDAPLASSLLPLLAASIESHNRPHQHRQQRGRMIIADAIAHPAAAFFLGASSCAAAPASVAGRPLAPSIDPSEEAGRVAVVVGSSVLRLPSGARVRLFYPAGHRNSTTTASSSFAPYCTDGRRTSDGMASIVGLHRLGLSFLLGHLAEASSGCVEDAAHATVGHDRRRLPSLGEREETTPLLPLLVYSHGMRGNMDGASHFFRTVASRGAIVAALEHTDGTASHAVLADGSERGFDEYYMTGRQQLVRRASELLEAGKHLPDEIRRRHHGVEIVGPVMLGGHGLGAASAIMAANGASSSGDPSESYVRGVVLHDPTLGMGYGILPPNGSRCRVPAVTYVSDGYRRSDARYGDVTLHARGSRHWNFLDAPLWVPRWAAGPLSRVVPSAASASYAIELHDRLADSAMAFLESADPTCEGVVVTSGGGLLEVVHRG